MPDPVAFTLGSLSVRWYGIMAALGFLAASWMIFHLRHLVANLTEDRASGVLFTAMVAGIAGGRIFYVVQFYERDFAHRPWYMMLRIDQGGLVFYGGMILATLAIIVYSRLTKLDLLRLLDIFAPALPLAHACGRIGCFLNGCCYGCPTESAFGVHYPVGSEPFQRYGGAALHPVQLYEAGENLLVAILMYALVRRTRRGTPTAMYLIVYGILRFFNDSFRGDGAKWFFGLLTPGQTVSILTISAGAAMLAVLHSYRRKHDGKNT